MTEPAGGPPRGDLLVDQLRLMARDHPEEIGYRDLDAGRSVTFRQWDEESNRLARGLVSHGVGPGDRVAIYLPNQRFLPWIVTYSAVHKAGAVAVPTNVRLTTRELQAVLGHAGISAAVSCVDLIDTLDEISGELPTLHTVVDTDERAATAVPWSTMLDPDGSDFQVPVAPGDLADIMYTSGTTGLPKGVAVRHRNVALLPNNAVPYRGAWLESSPPFTFAGISFVYNPMKLGMAGLFQARFDAGRWLGYVEEFRPTATFLVPATAQLLIHHDRWQDADLSSLTLVSVGSAPLPPETLVALCERFPDAVVTNGYGMTEAGPAYCAMSKDDVLKRVGSVGKPMPPMEVRIVAPDTGADVGPDQEGEVLIRAQGRQREYYGDPEATARTWTPDGWLHSGDVGKLDADGYLYIVGRMKDVIIRGGNNVHASDVEAVLYEHPGILEAAVAGIPHEVLGEDIAAFVVTKPGVELTSEDVEAFCRERLADYKCPRRVTFLDALPRNATGKVLKRDLVGPDSA